MSWNEEIYHDENDSLEWESTRAKEHAPECPYCHQRAILKSSEVIYGKGRNYGKLWVCRDFPACNAYVGWHKGTNEPLGTLANRELRELRKQAHALFDPLWRDKIIFQLDHSFIPGQSTRQKAYRWLADQLLIPREKCHFSQMDKATIEKAIRILQSAY